jgi:predicted nucleic acid-binding protein
VIIFSNTTPFIALASINKLELLPKLFEQIHVVTEVVEECAVGGIIPVPDLKALPWVIEVHPSQAISISILLELDKGEKYTLQMAKEMNADRVIIDEKIGRDIAEYLGLEVIGTLGILLKAKQYGWIESFTESAKAMSDQGIHYNKALIKKLAKAIGED